jgi:hypothetical protein
MRSSIPELPWNELQGIGPWGFVAIAAVLILLWKSPQIITTFLTHSRESKRIREDTEIKKRRLDLEIQTKMAKIQRGSKTGSGT